MTLSWICLIKTSNIRLMCKYRPEEKASSNYLFVTVPCASSCMTCSKSARTSAPKYCSSRLSGRLLSLVHFFETQNPSLADLHTIVFLRNKSRLHFQHQHQHLKSFLGDFKPGDKAPRWRGVSFLSNGQRNVKGAARTKSQQSHIRF